MRNHDPLARVGGDDVIQLLHLADNPAVIRSIRSRLGLSQGAFARLAGVSGQTVYQWERKEGRLDFRGGAKAAIVDIRKLDKQEAKTRLAELKSQA